MIPLQGKAWLAGIGALALIASHGWAYMKGRGAGAASVQTKYERVAAKVAAAMARAQIRMDAIGVMGAEASREQDQENRSIYRETLRIIKRPIYRNVCLDPDGVSLLDRAAANANRTPDFAKPTD